jgi:adenylate kinase family enzyme
MKHDWRSFNLILLGDIASGKATQASRLAKRYHLYDFDMGREVRRPAIKKLYNYRRTTGRGALTPTRVVRAILAARIMKMPADTGILFDGHPKMIGEAKLVARLLKGKGRTTVFFIYLTIPMAETLKRIRLRRKSVKRADDALSAAKRRKLGYYRTQIFAKVVPFFASRYPYKRVSGMGTREQVFRRLVNVIEREPRNSAINP